MKPSHHTCRQMHLESDSKMPYYKPEAVQAAQETKYQTKTYSGPSYLQAKACQIQKEDTETLNERH